MKHIAQFWDDAIVPSLVDYIKIPAKSPHFDKEWAKNGHIDAAVKHAADAEAFTAWVTAFYAAHTILVMQTLQMAQADAASYCGSQRQQILAGWLAALELWQTDHYASGLAALALEDEEEETAA